MQASSSKQNKAIFFTILALTVLLTIAFWAVIQTSHLHGLGVYFLQLGLYALFYLLAWWGLKREGIHLEFGGRKLLVAAGISIIGWLAFVGILFLLGATQMLAEFSALGQTPTWKVLAQIVSTWLFVGLGEEILFRGYFFKAVENHFTIEGSRRRTLKASLLSSVLFSLWHLPVRLVEVLNGGSDWLTLLLSLVVLFMLGLGFTYLYLRSDNIWLTGLVHGLNDYPLVGKNSQLSFIILLVAIGCVEGARWLNKRRIKIATPSAIKH